MQHSQSPSTLFYAKQFSKKQRNNKKDTNRATTTTNTNSATRSSSSIHSNSNNNNKIEATLSQLERKRNYRLSQQSNAYEKYEKDRTIELARVNTNNKKINKIKIKNY